MNKKALVSNMSRKKKVLHISPELVLEMLKISKTGDVVNGMTIRCVEDPIPQDAQVVQCFVAPEMMSENSGTIALIIKSEEFGEAEEGKRLPEIRPVYSTDAAGDSTAKFAAHMERKQKFNDEAERVGSPIRMRGDIGA